MRKSNSRGPTVEVREANINVALRKLKKKVEEGGTLLEVLANQHYEKPTTERKRKKGAARARWLKKIRDNELPKKLY
jgi:small subunit ribosomal protein S21